MDVVCHRIYCKLLYMLLFLYIRTYAEHMYFKIKIVVSSYIETYIETLAIKTHGSELCGQEKRPT